MIYSTEEEKENLKKYIHDNKVEEKDNIFKYYGGNMKTTIYELLGMIKDGKAPKKILFNNKRYELGDDYEYYCFEDKGLFEDLFSRLFTDTILKQEVEILETTITYKQGKKIEKIVEGNSWWGTQATGNEATLKSKINEIIDYINSTK